MAEWVTDWTSETRVHTPFVKKSQERLFVRLCYLSNTSKWHNLCYVIDLSAISTLHDMYDINNVINYYFIIIIIINLTK